MLLTNAFIITLDNRKTILEKGAIYYQDGPLHGVSYIQEIGDSAKLIKKYPKEKQWDAQGKFVIPGLINAHTHFYSGLARGISLKDPPPENFIQILQRLWWRLDRALDKESVYYSAMVELMDCIRHGTTTFIDHHASPNICAGSLDILEKAVNEFGVRACLCYEVSDRDGAKKFQQGVEENIRFIKKNKSKPSPRISTLFGLHASFTLSDKSLQICADAARDLDSGCHIHVCEDRYDLEDARARGYQSAIVRLNKLGILGNKTIVGHCIYLDPMDYDILKETGTTVIHNPHSNSNNAVGIAPIRQLLGHGIPVGLGSDGWTDGMFNELRLAILLPRIHSLKPQEGFSDAVQMAFENNSNIVGKIFQQKIGKIEKGGAADFLLLDYIPPTPITKANWLGHLVYGLSGAKVHSVVSSGKTILKNGKFTTIDEEKVLAKSRESAKKLWKRF